MLDYNGLEALHAVIKHSNFNRAAQSLFITQSAISQRIKGLEESIGQPILIRSPDLKPTELGQKLLRHYQQIRLLEKDLQTNLLGQNVNQETLTIAINSESLATWFIDAISPCLASQNLIINLEIGDQDQTLELLKTGKAWGCISSNATTIPGCISTHIGNMEYHFVASPSFQKKHFKNKTTSQTLMKAPAIIYGKDDKLHQSVLMKAYKAYKPETANFHYVPSPEGILEFCLKSLGYSILPKIMTCHYIKNCQLVEVLPNRKHELKLYWHTHRLLTTQTQEFSDQVIKHAAKVLA